MSTRLAELSAHPAEVIGPTLGAGVSHAHAGHVATWPQSRSSETAGKGGGTLAQRKRNSSTFTPEKSVKTKRLFLTFTVANPKH